jgi:hypothetical protein
MAKVTPVNARVLVRETSTTTYHFGLAVPICEETPTEGDAEPVMKNLTVALSERRRLCRKCADLVTQWAGAALSEASSTDLIHPDR